MLLYYDWRLALCSMIFPPFSYIIAEKMKRIVQTTGAAYKKQTGKLNAVTLDRITNALHTVFSDVRRSAGRSTRFT